MQIYRLPFDILSRFRLSINVSIGSWLVSARLKISNFFYKTWLKPLSETPETRRREFMVNVLLLGICLVSVGQIIVSLVTDSAIGFDQEEDSLIVHGFLLIISIVIWHVGRLGYRKIAAYSLLLVLTVEAMRVTLSWSFELPIAELLYALVIITSGVILAARSALIVSSLISLLLLVTSYLQVTGRLHPHMFWVKQHYQLYDALDYIAILIVIMLVVWLTDREVSNSLGRAIASEKALARQRDNLEIIVSKRTLELQQSQLLRNIELERFAEFGRLSANLLHEISNPLTAAFLNLDTFDKNESKVIDQTKQNLRQLERYIHAAKQQLRGGGQLRWFSVQKEWRELNLVIDPIAKQAGVSIEVSIQPKLKLYGDSIKFNQLLANLVINAIDAHDSDTNQLKLKQVKIAANDSDGNVILKVWDNGKGIDPEIFKHIYEPFYSTKSCIGRGTGIGLTTAKQVVERDFGGTILSSSSQRSGTQFFITLSKDIRCIKSQA